MIKRLPASAILFVLAVLSAVLLVAHSTAAAPQAADLKPEILRFDPFTWPSEIPQDCPFERSGAFKAIRFLGVKSGFRYGDTWYPTWAENDILYSPWTDGKTKRLDGYTDSPGLSSPSVSGAGGFTRSRTKIVPRRTAVAS